jgi:adenylate cyclase
MAADEEVDISGAPAGRRYQHLWLRIGVPLGGVLLVIAAILAIALYADRANRAGVLQLSDNLLSALQARIAQQVTDYLGPATRAAKLARDMVAQNVITDRRAALEAYATSALRQIPQIDALYVGDPAGNFMMVRRGAAGGTETKEIDNTPGARKVMWVYRDAGGRVTGTQTTPQDNYDPRTRSWYQGALKTKGTFWSGVYVFFTARAPGVTAAIRFTAPNGGVRVLGVDITLKALSGFLARLPIGRAGRAIIFDGTGHLIAAPDANLTRILRGHGDQLVAARVDQLGDAALTGAYDRFRVEGYGRRVISVDGQPVVSMAAPLPAAAGDWSLLIVVPEKDFTGFVAANSRRTLALSLIVVALSALLAALLVRQGLRADRTVRLLLRRGQAVARQSTGFGVLARQTDLFDPEQEAPVHVVTETLADITAARRASVWRLLPGGRLLHCEDAYEQVTGGHVGGLELARAELPQFFAALENGEEISVADAANDRRTAELHRVLMHPVDTRALYVRPVMVADDAIGAIILEDAAQVGEARDFVQAVANMLAARMHRLGAVAPAERVMMPATVADDRPPIVAGERSFAAELALRGLDPEAMGAEVFPAAAVMVIKFADPAAMAMPCAENGQILADRIAAALQEIAEVHDIPYMKLVGHDVIAAAGCTPGDSSAILRIAGAALAARGRCLDLFEEAGRPPAFRIGIDFGIAIGSQVGRQPRLFNLWGEAVRTADTMAASAAEEATIQVSEAAYQRLRQQFLFRPRGSFYVPRVGSARTFVLASRL